VKNWTAVAALVLFVSSLGVAGKNLTDYPLQVEIVESHWHNHRDGTVNGWGQGNVVDGDAIHGFDFSYEASEPFHRTRGSAHYLAKWKKSVLRMELIVGEIGSVDKYHSYDLKTSIRDEVYVLGPNGADAVSQEEFRSMQQQPQQQPQSESKPQSEQKP
jgi:hypothetical protein